MNVLREADSLTDLVLAWGKLEVEFADTAADQSVASVNHFDFSSVCVRSDGDGDRR
jgi:hypothetical protein